MAEPIGVAASILALLKLASSATQYLKDVKGGAVERTRLRDELRSMTCVLQMLQDRVDDAEDDDDGDVEHVLKPRAIASLAGSDGLLAQFRSTLEEIVAKLAPKAGRGTMTLTMKWPFEKKEVTELLGRMERLKTQFTLVLQNDLVSLAEMANDKLDSLGEQVKGLELSSKNEETERILSWISGTSFRAKHADVLASVEAGTGEWLLQDEMFLKWVSGDIDLFWCPGIPGAGKTRIASLVIKRIESLHQASSSETLAYVYCDYNQRETQTMQVLLASLLEQILRRIKSPTIPQEVKSLCEHHMSHNTRPTSKELSKVLANICSSFEVVHVVVDALDECSQSDEAALEFITTVRELGPSIRLFCTSRFSAVFDHFFAGATRIEVIAHDQDVRLFLETKLKSPSRLKQHIHADPHLQEDIVKTIVKRARGMFLLAALHLESLLNCHTRKKVRSSLQTLPKTLDTTYDQALVRIRSQSEEDADLAEAVIFWVLCAQRPLFVLELQHMYAVRLQMRDGDVPFNLEDEHLPPSELITSVCGGLVKTVARDYRPHFLRGNPVLVYLVHYSAQEYLTRVHQDRIFSTRFELTKICLDYLQLQNFASSPILTTVVELRERQYTYAFLTYAAGFWAAEIDDERFEGYWEHLEKFLFNQAAVRVATDTNYRYPFTVPFSKRENTCIPPLVFAAAYGTPSIIRRLVRDGHDIEAKGDDGETPLLASVFQEDAANTIALLDLGANVEAMNRKGDTPLVDAMQYQNFAAFNALLDGGTVVNRKIHDGSYLHIAVSYDSIDLVRRLIEAGAEVSALNSTGSPALSQVRSEEIGHYLLDKGVVLPIRTQSWLLLEKARYLGLSGLAERLEAHQKAVAEKGVQREASAAGETLARVFGIDGQTSEAAKDETRAAKSSKVTHEGHSGLKLLMDRFASARDFHDMYDIQGELGQCHNSKIYHCTSKVANTAYTVKVIKSSEISTRDDYAADLAAEIRCLDEFRDERIAGIVDTMKSSMTDELCLVLDFATYGDLLNYMTDNEQLSIPTIRVIFRQLFAVMASLHENGWVHRDIKPEHILLKEDLTIKLTGFGLATKLTDLPDGHASRLCGTPNYMAPEMLADDRQRKYGFPIDMWATGVVLYICLGGHPPFSSEINSPVYSYTLAQQISEAKFTYMFSRWEYVPKTTMNFVEHLLEPNPDKRCTAEHGMDKWRYTHQY